jgi:hypothetical protein
MGCIGASTFLGAGLGADGTKAALAGLGLNFFLAPYMTGMMT